MLILGAAAALTAAQPVGMVLLDQDQLDAISKHCETPPAWLIRHQDGIELRIPADATYGQGLCLLGELKRVNAGPLGFIGNEIPD